MHREPADTAGPRQRQRDHPGDDEDEHRQQLEEGGEDGAASRLSFARRAQRALHDVLVRAPVPQPDDRRAEQHAQPRVVAVEVPRDAPGLADRRPRAFEARRHERLPQVEHLGAEHGPQLAPAPEPLQAEDRQQQRAEQQDDRLHGLGVGHGPHAPDDRVQAGQDHDRHRPDPEAVEDGAADVHLQPRQQRPEHDATCEDADRDLGQHVGHERDEREDPARRRREPALEELRHRVHAGPHVERHEDPAEHQQAPRVQFVVRQRHATGGTGPRQADEVFRADVGGKDRGAHHEPAEAAACQEVVVGRVAALRHHPPGDAGQPDEIQQHHDPVETSHAGDLPPGRASSGQRGEGPRCRWQADAPESARILPAPS